MKLWDTFRFSEGGGQSRSCLRSRILQYADKHSEVISSDWNQTVLGRKYCFAQLYSLHTYFPWETCQERWLVKGIYSWFDCSWILFPNLTKISAKYLQIALTSSIVAAITWLTFCIYSKGPIKGPPTMLRDSEDVELGFYGSVYWLLSVPCRISAKETEPHPPNETYEPEAFSWWCVLGPLAFSWLSLAFSLWSMSIPSWCQCLESCTEMSLPEHLPWFGLV